MSSIKLIFVVLLSFPIISQGTVVQYIGSWNNTTFGSTGPASLTIDTNTGDPLIWSYQADLDGLVFGFMDPPPITILGPSPLVPPPVNIPISDPFFGVGSLDYSAGLLALEMTPLPGSPAAPFIQTSILTGPFVPGDTSYLFDYIIWFTGANPVAGVDNQIEGVDYALGNIELTIVPVPGGVLLMLTAISFLFVRKNLI